MTVSTIWLRPPQFCKDWAMTSAWQCGGTLPPALGRCVGVRALPHDEGCANKINTALPCVKKQHNKAWLCSVPNLYMCAHGKQHFYRVTDRKHMANYRTHGKKPVSGSGGGTYTCTRTPSRNRWLYQRSFLGEPFKTAT